ncbi:MAG: TIGR00282 family metallophosphoesterase [Calditrichaeota bacterium]|nr:MAG: TIGR00282 family metallophosphoesterase [Calditrichota bacterium]
MSDNTLRTLFVADVVGKPGYEVLTEILPSTIDKYKIDFVIANGENTNNGKGITESQAERFFKLGVDVITGGNHTWENWKLKELFQKEDRILRPANYPESNIGTGVKTIQIRDDLKVSVLNLQGRTFMYPIDCPFQSANKLIEELQKESPLIFVDFHAEATAEKIAMGWYLDGRVSAIIGTHTHVQTADERILPKGTAYITDAGMTGPHDSVIGMNIDIALHRFLKQTPRKFELATENNRFNAIIIDTNINTGQSKSIQRLSLPKD